LDYYTSGGTAGCPALLVEPSAANGILNSQDTATNWTLGASLSGTYENVIGVSGNNLTVAVSGSGIGFALGRLGRTGVNVALASGSTYTISFLMKQTGAHTFGGYYAAITGGAAGDLCAGFNVSGSFSSGSIFNTAGTTSRIRRVERFGTNVFRCSETFTMSASGTLTDFFVAPLVSVTSQDNPAVGTTMAFAAPQIELGSLPTSFIPTTAAPVTRNADVITLSGAVSGCIGQTEGTVYWDIAAVGGVLTGTGNPEFGVRNEAFTNWIGLTSNGTANPFRITARTTAGSSLINYQANIASGKAALAWSSAGLVLYVNGVSVATSATNPNFSFSRADIGNTSTMPFKTNAFALYTTRLTDSELAALTTL
jgi:hypothetical protein